MLSHVHWTGARSRVDLRFPLPSKDRRVAQNRGMHVLLAEDNTVNQRLATRLLEKRGHLVTVANNGQEAIAKLQQLIFRSGAHGCTNAADRWA